MNTDAPRTLTQRFLDVVEVAGNKVPHPALIFLTLIAIVVVLSHLLYLAGASVSHEVIVAETRGIETGTATYDTETTVTHGVLDEEQATVETRTVQVRSLLTADGVRFMYVSLVPNLMSFSAMGLMIAAMVGVGVAELSGLVTALIRKLAIGSPRWALTYILVLVGIVSSVASNAGYLVLVPLAGTAFLSVGRHPLAGLALGFAAVGGTFAVNLVIKPIDAVLVTFTNEAIHLVNPGLSIGLASNLWFSIVSVLLLTVLVARISERTIEPRLGTYEHEQPAQVGEGLSADESRGLRYASWAMLGVLVVFGLLALPPGAPLRDPHTGDLIGNTPFMDGLIAVIMLLFLAGGAAYGVGAGTMTGVTEVIKAIEKTMAGMGSLIFLFLVLSQFLAYFSYTNMGTMLAVSLANVLRSANVGPLWLLLGFIVVVAILDLFITGAVAKWAIFAPIFVPLLVKLGVAPEAVLAAYRVADSPANIVSPLLSMFALILTFFQKYDQSAGPGTLVALMLPYAAWILVVWTALFTVWFLLGLPWGL